MPDEGSALNMASTEPVKPATRSHLKRLLLFSLLPLVLGVAGVGYWLHSTRYVSTENAYVKTDIAKLSAEVTGKAVEVYAHAHKQVKKGEVLVKIDPRPFEMAVDRAKAELDEARQQVGILAVSLKEARAELEDAKDRAQYFRKRFERQIELTKRGITPHTRYDELENDANAADDRVTLVRQRIQRVMTALGGDPDKPVDEHPLVRTKMAMLDQAELDLERTTVKAPANGTVVTVPLVAGEQVKAADPLFAIVTDVEPWVDANFKETELTYVRVGQRAKVVLDIYPDVTWDAEVQSISPATGAEFALLPPQNASGNWVKVVQRLPVRLKLFPRPDSPPLRAGMAATATVDTGRERSIADLFQGIPAMADTSKDKPEQAPK